MRIRAEIGDCAWDHNGFPILCDREAVDSAIEKRLLGPQGQTEEQWLRNWREEHNTHYLDILDGLQRDRDDPKNRVAAPCLLVGGDYPRADLRNLDMSGMNLTNANFRGADLERANLSGAILVKCDFSRANLRYVIFDEADLSGSDMSMSYMKAASFRNTRMWRVHLRHAMAESAQFFGADMRYCAVRHADFWGAPLDGAIR